MKQAKRKYREILETVQLFWENDALEMNIISAALQGEKYADYCRQVNRCIP